MSRKPLSGDVFKITEELNKTFEGTYLGNRKTDTGHKNDDGTPKLSTIHTIETAEGPFSFWGFTAIDNILRQVKTGTYLWITYKGMVKAKNGKAHSVAVDYDDEPVGEPTAESSATAPVTAGFDPDEIPF